MKYDNDGSKTLSQMNTAGESRDPAFIWIKDWSKRNKASQWQEAFDVKVAGLFSSYPWFNSPSTNDLLAKLDML